MVTMRLATAPPNFLHFSVDMAASEDAEARS